MEIRNLKTFAQVAEFGSFTRAAEALSYSQSTVSFQIKQLETELDCLLFERINHTITLTEDGRRLLDYAKEILQLSEAFHEDRGRLDAPNGRLRVAAPDSLCEAMLHTNYTDFHAHYPSIALTFIPADTLEMFRMLDHNETDLLLTLDRHTYRSDYIIEKEEAIPMRFVTGANSPFATDRHLSVQELVSLPFILTENGVGYRRVLEEELARRSLEILPILEIGRTDIIVQLLAKGVGVSFLPAFVCDDAVRNGSLVYLQVPELELHVWKQLIRHRDKWLSRSLSALIAYIKKNEFGPA